MKKPLKAKRGGMIFSAAVMLMCSMMVIAFAMHVYPVLIDKQRLDTYATELCRVASVSGEVGDETSRKEELLNQSLGISPNISWSKTGKIQLNETVTVTCTMTKDLGLFSSIGSFPVTLTGKATAESEVYYK